MKILGHECYITRPAYSRFYQIELKHDNIFFEGRKQLVYHIGKELNILKYRNGNLYVKWDIVTKSLLYIHYRVLSFPVFDSIESAKNFISMANSKFLIKIRTKSN